MVPLILQWPWMVGQIWMWDKWIGLSSSMSSLNTSALGPQLGAFKKNKILYVWWKGGRKIKNFPFNPIHHIIIILTKKHIKKRCLNDPTYMIDCTFKKLEMLFMLFNKACHKCLSKPNKFKLSKNIKWNLF